jgi:outer membrane protein assembly factor BamB
MVAVKLDDAGGRTTPSLVWEDRKTLPYVPTLLLQGEHLYAVNDLGTAFCYVAATGERVWAARLGGNFTASPVLIDGKVYAINEEGDVFVFAADPGAFQLLAKNRVGEAVYATPAVSNNRLFIRGSEHLFCIGRPPTR